MNPSADALTDHDVGASIHAQPVKPVIVIGGPTASGKSILAADLAERLDGVVINADSMQVYSGLEVLTSAPDAALRARAPHRLFGFLRPDQLCSAGEWRDLAIAEIQQIHGDGKVPIVVGGTGLYLRSLMSGIAQIPAIPAVIRDRVRESLKREGSVVLHGRLRERDPRTADHLSEQDGQRICRALEVLEATGRPLSDWQGDERRPDDLASLRFLTVLLLPPRDVLYPVCDQRFSRMLEDGALDEVRHLADLHLDPALPSMKALGVPQLRAFLSGEITLCEARRQGQQATRRYVKRQMTWFTHQFIADHCLKSQYHERNLSEIFPKISEFVLTEAA